MVVHVDTRGDWRSVERSGLEMPPAKSGLDFFVDPVADRLHNFGFDDIPLRIYCYYDDNIADQVQRKFSAIDRRVRMHNRVRDVDFMAGDRTVNHGAERRPGMGIVVALLRVGDNRLRLGLGLRRARLRARSAGLSRKYQLGCIGRRVIVRVRCDVDQFVGMRSISKGKPSRSEVDHLGIMKHDHSQHREMRGYRHAYGPMAPESPILWLKLCEHDNP
jgi:hypothetical protein